MGTYARQDIVFVRGEGCWLISEGGERYLDFGSGVAVNALGHAHPKLVEALKTQAEKLWHTSNLYRVEGQETVAEKLTRLTFADQVFFCNSGAEAVEGAIKVARRYHYVSGAPERQRIIAFRGAFHGRTLATLAAAGNEKYLEGFGPTAEGFDHVEPGDLEAVEALIGPTTAAILLEPIQGEGGVRSFSAEFLRSVRELCDTHGLLLVLDEVQTGVGRTGKLFAHEWAGITPDVMAIAKGFGGGFPTGAVLATAEAAKGMTPGTHGSTFGGNPLAMAVASTVLDVITEPGFLEAVQTKALHLKQGLEGLKDQHAGLVEEVRGAGLLTGLKLKSTITPAQVVKAANEEKLLIVGAGDNSVRIIPPLIATEEEIGEGVRALSRALTRVAREMS
ncbi:aspartate aminotransferase family protein [Hyphomicrobium sp.]|uniref:aspartate aminotransferase family protein n=1 Tax=Hyphomicrobium sp. TaxID=82 RepID=UPI002D773708|nr:aspartate aminotransferase family protein [Hyphomicrobium sp.]HET6388349.1 aspartate aminotransferase family protein [Hyphomicrobium sp.]